MIFALQIEDVVEHDQLVDFLIHKIGVPKRDINKLAEDNIDATINYEIRYRDYPSEFKVELLLFLRDQTCIELEIYNSLQIALLFVDFFSKNVVIKDESYDPFRWILITDSRRIFIVDEIIEEGEGLFIDYNSVKEVTITRAFNVLPDRSYFLTKPEDRPVYFNQDSTWG